jgi:predicted nucleic acid-binding protein
MILVDTSIWIDHLRQSCEKLVQLLGIGQVLAHPYIIGELALGSLQNRNAVLGALQNIPQVPVATDNEVLHYIETNALYGIGIGYIDAHLLAAARLSPGTLLWTRDKRLLDASTRLGLAFSGVAS